MRQVVFILLFFFLTSSLAHAQIVTPQTDVLGQSNYFLPYPGILPDNPLYILKSIRDGVVGFLISSPNKKAEFDLEEADKSLQEAIFLVDKKTSNSQKLALTSLKKGDRYFQDSIHNLQLAVNQKYIMNGFMDRMQDSIEKHQEVYQDLIEKMPSEKSEIQKLLENMQRFEESVNSIRAQL